MNAVRDKHIHTYSNKQTAKTTISNYTNTQAASTVE